MTTETKAEFARRVGIHKSNVTRAAQAGRIVLTPSGRVDVEASLTRWQQTKGGRTDVEARHAEKRGSVIPAPQSSDKIATAAATGATEAQPDGTEGSGRARYKALALDYENRQIKLEMALRAGRRYPLEDVKREALGLGAMLRAAFERLIDQTAPRLSVVTDAAERSRLIEAESRRLRWMVKTEMPRALRRMRKAATGTRGKDSA